MKELKKYAREKDSQRTINGLGALTLFLFRKTVSGFLSQLLSPFLQGITRGMVSSIHLIIGKFLRQPQG